MSDSESPTKETTAPGADNGAQGAGHTQGDDNSGLKNKNRELLDELKSTRKELQKMKDEQDKAKTESLKEQQKYKELYEKTITELENTKQEISKSKKENNLIREMSAAGMDIELMPVIAKRVEYNDDGEIKDAENFFNSVKEKKPQWFIDQQEQNVPHTDNTKTKILKPGKQKFTNEQITDPDFFEKNKDAILTALAAGELD